jgi:hypothetical protein
MGIELHPFLDKAGKPETAGYRRPEEVEFLDGTLANYMPSSVGGKHVRGVVIPHAKPFGGSRAYDPLNPPNKKVHIDPHIEGQSVVVDLGLITPEIAQEAMQLGQEFADKHADQVHGVDQIRLRSAAAFHLIGASQRNQTASPPKQAEVHAVSSAPQGGATQQASGSPAAAASAPRTIKAASFNGTPVQPTNNEPRGGLLDAYQKQRPPRQIDMPPASALPVEAPTKKVTFGVPGFGLHEAYYHDVIINKQAFCLVWDERYRGGNKYFPQIDGPFAARVEGDPVDYKLVWPDYAITDPATGRTYFSLYIEERVPQGQGEAQ